MKHIETVGKFCICKDSKGFFWAIREEWIDSKGKLTRQVNGLEGMMSETLELCRERARDKMALDELREQGVPSMVAVMMVSGKMTRQEAEDALRKAGVTF